MSDAEDLLCFQVKASGLPEPVRELRFSPPRRWRFDLAWPALRVAAEVDGGAWVGGRHTRGAGFAADAEKLNAATLQGWRVVRFTPAMVESGAALATLQAVIGGGLGDAGGDRGKGERVFKL